MTSMLNSRPLTTVAIVCAGLGSALFNVWGAYQIFSGPAALIFAAVIASIELLAILSLAHIAEDFSNNHVYKPSLASLIFALCVFGCAYSGHTAFKMQVIEIEQTNAAELAKADRIQTEADRYFAEAKAATTVDARNRTNRLGEQSQAKVDRIRTDVKKKAPPTEVVIIALLALFELVKCGGRYAIATPTTKIWSRARRRKQYLKERQAMMEEKAKFDEAVATSKVTQLHG